MTAPPRRPADGAGPLELWVGAECTINRIGGLWHDQSAKTGFACRPGDLDRLASLGAKRVRLPVLWERAAAGGGGALDWRWPDFAFAKLRELRIAAIVGLLHHGSGPAATSLIDPRFPARFANYARRVARRYPEQRFWTPVNEPVTTARFSGLYGLWYPHRANDRDFVRALLQQVHGTVAAMREIRKVNPGAQLIQTDDVGHTRCTPTLVRQAEFDNQRRWLGFDLLCGRVDPRHPMWRYLVDSGATLRELGALQDGPCVPDLIGVNAYVTSERFLDERLGLYPDGRHGGNGAQRYVDVETARAHGEPIHGFAGRLDEVWERYGLPIAITEVHLGCTREEQLRWMHQAWEAAAGAREKGVDVRAVTAWAAFGAMDWNSLLTKDERRYEPGLWDIRSDPPRITALGRLARALGNGVQTDHPVQAGAGWWQRDIRLRVLPHGALRASPIVGAPLLVTGGRGTLARAFGRLCHMRGLPHQLMTRGDMDIADAASVAGALERHRPWAVVNTAGFVRVDDAESDRSQWRDNTEGAAVLAMACRSRGVRLLGFSSDLVFAGSQRFPYVETDPVGPLNAYGLAKAQAERMFLEHSPQALVVRTAAFFGPWDQSNFASQGLAGLERGQPWHAARDQVVSPTYVPDLVQAALDLLIDGEHGVWHLTNEKALTWSELACRLAENAGLARKGIVAASSGDLGQKARRPAYSALRSARGRILPTLDDALRRFQAERELGVPGHPPDRGATVIGAAAA
ncbi:MAG: sugar nucleotide-binding protein [Burkholderiaceae bacterium]